MAITNQNFSAMNRLSFVNKNRADTIMLLTMFQEMINLNPLFPDFMESNVFLSNLNFNYSFIPLGISINGGYNYSESRFGLGVVTSSGPVIGFGKSFFKNKLNSSFTSSVLSNSFNGESNGITVNGGLNLSYRLSKANSFVLNIRAIHNTSNNPLSVPFTEAFFSAGYQFTLP
jgi:hypothetical protein